MNLFDKLKQKTLEKMMEKMAGGSEAKGMLESMGASEADISNAMQSLKGMNISSLMAMFQAFSQGQPITADKIRSLFDARTIEQAAAKLKVPVGQAPEKMAEMMNQAMTQFRSSK